MKLSTPVAAPSSVAPELAELVEVLTARVKAGESVDLDALVNEHPAHADELRRLFPAMKLLAALSGSSGASVAGLCEAGSGVTDPGYSKPENALANCPTAHKKLRRFAHFPSSCSPCKPWPVREHPAPFSTAHPPSRRRPGP